MNAPVHAGLAATCLAVPASSRFASAIAAASCVSVHVGAVA